MSSTSAARPLLALSLGDPAGIGPEIALAASARPAVRDAARLVLIGPAALRPTGFEDWSDAAEPLDRAWLATEAPASWSMGEVQAACGQAALAALHAGAELAAEGRVAALVTAPVHKAALHAAGERVEGQSELLARWAGVERYEMLAIAGELRVMLLTRHMPLRAAIAGIETAKVVDRLLLLHETLSTLGIGSPRLALAGLNPHAGEDGLFGDEEELLLEPALRELQTEHELIVAGPISPDTVFLKAAQGAYDGVLALYHDQAFIPLKLLSEDRGLTLLAGLPYLRVSPVHGTAFDIAGQGRASAENLVHALLAAARWASPESAREG